VNFLVNYGWEWDLSNLVAAQSEKPIMNRLYSAGISRIDLIIRWGNMRRLSGFLPVQSVYSDFYVVEEMWPDFHTGHLQKALEWYNQQDITLGG
jgi:undecaprenyl diphosphate synthase